MARNPRLNWNRLLDGGTYVLNLDDIDWQQGLSNLRAKVHYEVDRRRGVAYTHKVDVTTLEIRAINARVVPRGPCSCGAQPWDFCTVTCTSLGDNAATFVGQPAPQDQPSTPDDQALEPDDEALLGPCTCGQSPQCLPECARVHGAAASEAA